MALLNAETYLYRIWKLLGGTINSGGTLVGGGDVPLVPNQETVAIQTSSTLLIGANPSRKYLLIDNISDSTVFVHFGGAATVDADIHIVAGGNLELSAAFGNLWLGAIYAIADGAVAANVAYLEGV